MAREGGAGTGPGGSGRKIDLPERLELGLDELPPGAGGAGRRAHNGTAAGNGDTVMTGNGEAEGLAA